VHALARIRFSLPSKDLVSLRVYDLAGRQMVSPLDRVLKNAGLHEVVLDARDWPPGCYYYRLVVGGRTSARKMVVLH
jgi:hypothetical protein